MDKMTDARAVEVLAAMREDGGVVADADYTAAIDHVIARLGEPAEAQAQGGGEVVAERHALYGIRWIKQLRDMKPGTQWFIEGRAEPIATVTSSAGVLWHMAESEIPHGTKYRAAPPSAPVGVGAIRQARAIIDHVIHGEPGYELSAAHDLLTTALAQQPAAVDVFDLDCPHSAIGGCDLCAAQPGGSDNV